MSEVPKNTEITNPIFCILVCMVVIIVTR